MPVPGAVTDPSAVEAADIRVATADGHIEAYLARPTTPGPRPGIIVIHEAFGPNDHIHDLARRFAFAGFDALAPNLYSRVGTPEPTDFPAIMATMFALPDAQAVSDLEAAAAHLRSLDDASGRVGVIGFCSGGRHTLLFACSSTAVDAAVDCWGGFIDAAAPDAATTPARPTPVLDLVPNLGCPLFAVGGADDGNPSPEVLAELERRFRAAGKDATLTIFPNVGHAFLADYRPSYDEQAAHELWPQVIDFFRAKLG